jgi:hypothetical protein
MVGKLTNWNNSAASPNFHFPKNWTGWSKPSESPTSLPKADNSDLPRRYAVQWIPASLLVWSPACP